MDELLEAFQNGHISFKMFIERCDDSQQVNDPFTAIEAYTGESDRLNEEVNESLFLDVMYA